MITKNYCFNTKKDNMQLRWRLASALEAVRAIARNYRVVGSTEKAYVDGRMAGLRQVCEMLRGMERGKRLAAGYMAALRAA